MDEDNQDELPPQLEQMVANTEERVIRIGKGLWALKREFGAIENERIRIIKPGPKTEAWLHQFSFIKQGTFSIDDPRVIEEAKNLASKWRRLVIVVGPPDPTITLHTMVSAQNANKPEPTSKSKCFVATAVYGSPLAPEVTVFRRFRDDVLLPSKLGASGVRVYYLLSPALATVISRHMLLRQITRRFFLEPILRFIKN